MALFISDSMDGMGGILILWGAKLCSSYFFHLISEVTTSQKIQ